ncbi:hypothetical protein ACVW19_006735 [Streptomyces sp. TE5632]
MRSNPARAVARRRKAGAGPKYELVFTDRVLVTLVRLRTGLTHEALGVIYEVGSSTIGRAISEIRPLLAARGFAVPDRPGLRLRTLEDVFAYAAAENVTLRIDGTETQVRRPQAHRPGRRAFVSGKRRQNTIKTTTISDHQGRRYPGWHRRIIRPPLRPNRAVPSGASSSNVVLLKVSTLTGAGRSPTLPLCPHQLLRTRRQQPTQRQGSHSATARTRAVEEQRALDHPAAPGPGTPTGSSAIAAASAMQSPVTTRPDTTWALSVWSGAPASLGRLPGPGHGSPVIRADARRSAAVPRRHRDLCGP